MGTGAAPSISISIHQWRRRRACSLGPREERATGGSGAAAEVGPSWSSFAESCVEETPGVEPGSPSHCSKCLAPADSGSVFGSVLGSLSGFSWNKITRRKCLRLMSRPHVFLCGFISICDLFLLLFLLLFIFLVTGTTWWTWGARTWVLLKRKSCRRSLTQTFCKLKEILTSKNKRTFKTFSLPPFSSSFCPSYSSAKQPQIIILTNCSDHYGMGLICSILHHLP